MISKKLEKTSVKSSTIMLGKLLKSLPQNLLEDKDNEKRAYIWSAEKKPNGSIEVEWRDENSYPFTKLVMHHIMDDTFLLDIMSKSRSVQNKLYFLVLNLLSKSVKESQNCPHLSTITQMLEDGLKSEFYKIEKEDDKEIITTDDFKITVEYNATNN